MGRAPHDPTHPRVSGRPGTGCLVVRRTPDRSAAAGDERGRRLADHGRGSQTSRYPRREGRGLPARDHRVAVHRGGNRKTVGGLGQVTARRTIELRSDTFTLPTPAMRRAMADAEVGDDQYGEDPTVNRLERRSAEIVGKEAAVYVASGMLGNLCGVLSQTERGDEVILGDLAHIYQNEMGASFVLGSIQPRLVPNRSGLPSLEDIEGAMRPAGVIAAAALVGLEEMRDRLGDDHRNAKAFAKGLAGIRGIRIDADRVVTNIVSFEVDSAWMEPASFVKACAEQGLRIARYLGNSPRLRAVTHNGVEAKDIDDALAMVSSVLSQARSPVAAAD